MIFIGIVSLIQLSEHPLVPAYSDKSPPTVYVDMLLLESGYTAHR